MDATVPQGSVLSGLNKSHLDELSSPTSFWASTTPGESMLLTFGVTSGESKSAWCTSAERTQAAAEAVLQTLTVE